MHTPLDRGGITDIRPYGVHSTVRQMKELNGPIYDHKPDCNQRIYATGYEAVYEELDEHFTTKLLRSFQYLAQSRLWALEYTSRLGARYTCVRIPYP